MKTFVASVVLAITAVSMIAEAAARPMGGKRSFGRQSQAVRQMPAPAPAPAPGFQQRQPSAVPATTGAAGAAAAARSTQRSGMWKGILGGALLGLGLGALLSHFGIGGALASALSAILMIGLLLLAVLFVVRMFRRKDTPANPAFGGGYTNPVPVGAASPAAGSTAGAVSTPEIGSGLRQPAAFQGQPQGQFGNVDLGKAGAGAAATHTQWGVPGDFDQEAFLRHAQAAFIRMQAAWDRGDTNDLREFTTPEVFAELKMQIQERGGAADFTDVVTISAQLLGIETSATDYLASVQFNGMIRTAPNAPAEPFVEVWNMSKPLSGQGGWVLAGIQQLS